MDVSYIGLVTDGKPVVSNYRGTSSEVEYFTLWASDRFAGSWKWSTGIGQVEGFSRF